MEKFTRYIDREGRMFIVINRWADIDIKEGEITLKPTTCDVLNVQREKLIEFKVSEFEQMITDKFLTRVIK